MKQSMISIVTVCYNSEATIERTIRSVLRQTDHRCEHIIIDGASTDRTVEIITSFQTLYKEAKIPLIVSSEPDDGYYDAMNKGIALAHGDRIGILNSDDTYAADTVAFLNRIDRNAQVTQNRMPDIIMGAIRVHNGSRTFIKRAGYRKYYQSSRNFNHPAMFVTPDCYRRIGRYHIGNVHNDFRWYLKALKKGATVFITGRVLADFYTGGESAPKKWQDVKNRIRKKYAVYRAEGYSPLYMTECIGMELVKFLLIHKDAQT